MNLLVAIVGLIILVCAYRGMKRGLIKTVFSLFSMIIALILTLWISPIVSNKIQTNENIVNYFAKRVEAAFITQDVGNDLSEQSKFIERLPLPKTLKVSINENNNPDTYIALAANSFSSYISHAITRIIINVIAFIITYLVVFIALRIICVALDIISKLPLLHQVNKLAGLCVGVIYGFIIVWLMFVLLTGFAGTEIGQKAFVMIEESEVLKYIYNNNLILYFITKVSKLFLI